MPQLKTAKHERFAQAYARGVNGTNAAKEAGYPAASAHVRASELLKRDDVKARLAELREKGEALAAKRVALSKEEVLKQLLDVATKAMRTNNLTAANRAWELIGKELGMFVDRKMEVRNPLEALNAQQIQALTALAERVVAEAAPPPAQPPVDLERTDAANEVPA